MDRRTFLKTAPIGAASALATFSAGLWIRKSFPGKGQDPLDPVGIIAPAEKLPSPLQNPSAVHRYPVEPMADEGALLPRPATAEGAPQASPTSGDPLVKIRNFDISFEDDFYLTDPQMELLTSVVGRLTRAQKVIGHGHFNILGLDQIVRFGRNFSQIGRFTSHELSFLEELFDADANRYGFFGDKVLQRLTATIPDRQVFKVPGTGHYLLRGEPLKKYRRLCKDVGQSIVLTSGVRGIVKQFHLFLSKAVETEGNLSRASRSLAPPGYSYHAVGDFDIGKVGFGLDNFTEAFAETDEFKRLIDLGYVSIRYTEANPFGVRHEPWHIKIA